MRKRRTGIVLAGAVMLLLKRTRKFSLLGVSIAGGITHNVGQILTAMALLQTKALGWYLLVYSVGRFVLEFFRGDTYRGLSGALIGVIGGELCRRLEQIKRKGACR